MESPAFPNDHPVEILRGYPRPDLSRAKRALVRRCTWLANKIQTHARTGSAVSGTMLEELAAVVLVLELAERAGLAATPLET